jgi:ribosomal protein S18 acetylase RimI-like enzyme
MVEFKILKSKSDYNEFLNQEVLTDFLHIHLDKFRDSKSAINKALDYAFSEESGKGGFVIAAMLDNELAGCLVMNNTGMSEFIPENILVYIAVHENQRGKGLGGKIIRKAFEIAEGDIKLHVEYDNPAKRLYERLGFTTKYAEMRYTKKEK